MWRLIKEVEVKERSRNNPRSDTQRCVESQGSDLRGKSGVKATNMCY